MDLEKILKVSGAVIIGSALIYDLADDPRKLIMIANSFSIARFAYFESPFSGGLRIKEKVQYLSTKLKDSVDFFGSGNFEPSYACLIPKYL